MGLLKSVINCISQKPVILRKTSVRRIGTRVTPGRVTQICTTLRTARIASDMLSDPAEETLPVGVRNTVNVRTPVRSADPMQMRLVDDLYQVLDAASVGSCNVREVQAAFWQDIRLAAKASVFNFWPFPKDDVVSPCQLLTNYQLSSIVDQAFTSGHLPNILPLIDILLTATPPRSTHTCPELLDLLDQLANVSKNRATPNRCRDLLQQMLRPWVQPVQRALAKLTPVQLPATSRAVSSTDSQQQVSTSFPHWLSDTAKSYIEEQPLFEQMAPYVWTPPPGYVELVEKDDLSPYVHEAYSLVENSIPTIPTEELNPNPIWSKHRHLLGKIGGGPHGTVAIQAYLKKKSSNSYVFDFNERNLQRSRVERSLEENGAAPPFDPDYILSVGADAGFMDADNDNTSSDMSDEEDRYL